jgi:hypothetical protein
MDKEASLLCRSVSDEREKTNTLKPEGKPEEPVQQSRPKK